MHEFKVWAPGAAKVSVKAGDALYAMHGPDGHGWWNAAVEDAVAKAGCEAFYLGFHSFKG